MLTPAGSNDTVVKSIAQKLVCGSKINSRLKMLIRRLIILKDCSVTYKPLALMTRAVIHVAAWVYNLSQCHKHTWYTNWMYHLSTDHRLTWSAPSTITVTPTAKKLSSTNCSIWSTQPWKQWNIHAYRDPYSLYRDPYSLWSDRSRQVPASASCVDWMTCHSLHTHLDNRSRVPCLDQATHVIWTSPCRIQLHSIVATVKQGE